MSTNNPVVSVVVPSFNASAYLAECLASIRAQGDAPTLEIIVVDDGSTDDTSTVLGSETGIRVLCQPNRGPSAARNAGMAAARGEFIAFLDADDLWPAGKLSAQMQVLECHPAAALVFGDCRQFDADGPRPTTEFEAGRLGRAAWGDSGIVPEAHERLLQNNFITTGSVVLRRTALADSGGFDESLRLVEDLDLWLRIAERHAIACCDSVCLLRRRHDRNTSRDPEAMSLAYLEVLDRQRVRDTARATGRATVIDRLVASEHAQLARLALQRDAARAATAHAWRGLMAHPSAAALWLLSRAAFKLLAQRWHRIPG